MADRLHAQALLLEAEAAALDTERELVERLEAIEQAAERVESAEGIDALRAALTATFEAFELHAEDGRLTLVPRVRAGVWRAGRPRAALRRHASTPARAAPVGR